MDDRHPSGAQLPTAPASDASYAHAAYGDGDPLFGAHPGGHDHGGYGTGGHPVGDHLTDAYGTGSYPTTGYDTTAYGTTGYDPYAHTGYDTPGYDTTAPYSTGYDTTAYGLAGGYDSAAHGSGAAYGTGSYDTGGFGTHGFDGGAYDTGGYDTGASYGSAGGLTGGYDTGSYPTAGYPTTGYDTTAYDTGYGTAAYDTASFAAAATAVQEPIGYEATAVWSTADYADHADRTAPSPAPAPGIPAQAGPPADDTVPVEDTVLWDQPLAAFAPETAGAVGAADEHDATDASTTEALAPAPSSIADAMTQAMPVQAMPVTAVPDDDAPLRVDGPPAGKAVRGRGRRRQAKRSALLTVAVPSVAAMGVCAAAAASVSQFGGDDKDGTTTQAAPDAGAAKRTTAANKKLDSQLAGLSASAQDFRERASRTQERLDLKQRQADERKRKEEEAARKEALRPKFVLPVTQHGLSALFGQAGVNWMSVHTGIDFPVSYGTPVMSATDGTVRTQWNSAYGNMAIVTSPDGTETWYCHLSSAKVRSGTVKAGDTIAYSGNSGNSTGPHLHFEVRPGGGSAIDPIPWLRAHDLNPY
ncbi:peptidoglycan DD-metalloendopeptidase family protein [Streptomyces yunnanensis]|uniref:Murein DD-endopeptidase MepM and murein hydrolase activator NlpD, contain LysM domain n=1 Tax=Streptomyces yunnanensis TaxID=156453 RepID=A0A9X8MYQ8_9ACTN|nr:peptidoglycan DD-metalloendopeptidase family protein [Streptomyces yunnanensis]SHM33883.1 Murein DD-endopeptidase MepM and murein hydrolase activator NlpD, contain LysM domain [Streptomyces yunnanensis]